MKRYYIPILTILLSISLFGCTKKADNDALKVDSTQIKSDTTMASMMFIRKSLPFHKYITLMADSSIGHPTTVLTPPAAAGNPIHLQAGVPADIITIQVHFADPGDGRLQLVTIAGAAPAPLVYANQMAGAPVGAIVIPAGQAATFIYLAKNTNITANFGNPAGAYDAVSNAPNNAPIGSLTTTYSDAAGNHQAFIAIICGS